MMLMERTMLMMMIQGAGRSNSALAGEKGAAVRPDAAPGYQVKPSWYMIMIRIPGNTIGISIMILDARLPIAKEMILMRTRSLKTNGVRSAKVVCPSCKWTCRRKSLKEAPKVMAYLLTWTKAGMKYNANSVYKFFFLGWKIMRRQHHASPWFLPRLKLAWSLTGRAPLRYWGDNCLGSFLTFNFINISVH